MSAARRPRPARTRLAAALRAVHAALEAALDEGVPREALAAAGLEARQATGWLHAFAHAEEVAAALAARAAPDPVDPAALPPGDPLLVRLVVAAAGLAALAREARLEPGRHPTFAALAQAVATAYEAARRARDRTLWRALADAA